MANTDLARGIVDDDEQVAGTGIDGMTNVCSQHRWP